MPPEQNTSSLILDLGKVDQGTAIRTWMAYHNVKLKDLAGRIGVSASTISRILAGKRRPAKLTDSLVSMGFPPELLQED